MIAQITQPGILISVQLKGIYRLCNTAGRTNYGIELFATICSCICFQRSSVPRLWLCFTHEACNLPRFVSIRSCSKTSKKMHLVKTGKILVVPINLVFYCAKILVKKKRCGTHWYWTSIMIYRQRGRNLLVSR